MQRTDTELTEKPLVVFAVRKYSHKVRVSQFECPIFFSRLLENDVCASASLVPDFSRHLIS